MPCQTHRAKLKGSLFVETISLQQEHKHDSNKKKNVYIEKRSFRKEIENVV